MADEIRSYLYNDRREWPGYEVKNLITSEYRKRHGLGDADPLPADSEQAIMQELRNDAYDFFVRGGRYVDDPTDLAAKPDIFFEDDGEWEKLLAYDVPPDHVAKREAERAQIDAQAVEKHTPEPEPENVRIWPAFDVERELTEAYRAEHQIADGEPLSRDDVVAVMQMLRNDAYDFFVRGGRYVDEPKDLKPVPDPLYKESGFYEHLLGHFQVSTAHAELREKERVARDGGMDLNYGLAADLPDTELPEEPDIDEPDAARRATISSFFDKGRPDIDENDALPPPDLSADDLAQAAIDPGEAPADTPVDLPPPPPAPDITAPTATETLNVTGNTVQQPPSPPLSSQVEPTPSPGPVPTLGQTPQPYQGGAAPYAPQQQAHRQFEEPGQSSGPREPQPAIAAAAQEVGALVAAAASGATSLTKGLLSGLMMGLRKPTPTPQEDQQLFLKGAQAAVSSAEIATDKAVEACQAFEACEEVRSWREKVESIAKRTGMPPSAVIADMPKRHPDLLDEWKQTLSVPDVADRYRDMTTAVQHHQDAWLSAANAAQQADASAEKYFDHAEPASRRLREETKAIPTPDGKSTIAETIRKFMDNLQQHVRRLFGLGAAAGSRPAPARP